MGSVDPDIDKWDVVAKDWDRLITRGDSFRQELIDPKLIEWLKPLKGKTILDAGCGEGYLSNLLAGEGARVHGLDASRKLIEVAKNKYQNPQITFLEGDLKTPLPFPEGFFDAIVANLVLMDFDPIDRALHEFARVLKPGGLFIFTLLHPFFGRAALTKNWKEKILFKTPHYKLKEYVTPVARPRLINGLPSKTIVYHRPLEFYFKKLKDASFMVTDLEEPVFEKSFVKDKSNFMKLSVEIPPFLLVKAKKVTPYPVTDN